MDNYRKKQKICLDQPAIGNQADTAKATVGVSARSEMVAPNTGIGGGVEFYFLALALMVVVLAITVYLAKKGKIVFFALALMIGLTGANFATKTNQAFAENTDIANCQKIGFSEYDIVARLGYYKSIYDGSGSLVKLEWVTTKEIIIAGTGSRDNDLQKLADGPEQEFHKYLEDEIKQTPGLNYSLYPPVEPDVDSEDQIFNFDYIFWI